MGQSGFQVVDSLLCGLEVALEQIDLGFHAELNVPVWLWKLNVQIGTVSLEVVHGHADASTFLNRL
jgi:hypothetical protein